MRRVTSFHSRDFRLANLGWKLLGSRRSRGKFWFVPGAAMKYRPGDPGELIGEGYGQHIFVKSRTASVSQRAKAYFVQLLCRKRTE